ncbi:MAG: OmpA family protein [Bacteroidetes bacterium]|nr:OmpA family protein [Bacteroidota bacterium]
MRLTVLSMLLILCICKAKTQNIVQNGDFEEFKILPQNFSAKSEDFSIPGWRSPTKGTPDYFNALSFGSVGIPRNWAGITYAHSGKGCAGIIASNGNRKGSVNYREYIQGRLKVALEKDKVYEIGFYFKLSSNSLYSSDRIGLLLLDSALRLKDDNCIQQRPTMSVIRHPLSAGNWELAKMKYTARGGESFVIIGNFWGEEETESLRLGFREGRIDAIGFTYYYVDDVKINPLETDEDDSARNLKKGNKNSFKNILFDFDSYNLKEIAFAELDTIAKTMIGNNRIRVEINGYADDLGSTDYNIILSLKRAEAVKKYLINHSIDESRLIVIGKGKDNPTQFPITEIYRSKNRRVEVKMID